MNKIITFFVILAVFLAPVFSLFTNEAEAAVTTDLYPSGEGSYLSWIPKAGTTHYTMVDESSCNGTTDFIKTSTVGDRDSFNLNLSSIPNGSAITNINVVPCASRNSATLGGSSYLGVFYRLNGEDSDNFGSYTLSGVTPSTLLSKEVNDLSILKQESTDLEIGFTYLAGNRGVRLSNFKVIITYSPVPLVDPNFILVPQGGFGYINYVIANNSFFPFNPGVTNGWLRYSTTNGECDDDFGTAYHWTTVSNGGDEGRFCSLNGISTLSPDSTYNYCLVLENENGKSYSEVKEIQTAPGIPNYFSVVDSPLSNTLSWNDNSSTEEGYKIFRQISTANNPVVDYNGFVEIAELPAGSESYVDTDIATEGVYFYHVQAYRGGSFSNSLIYAVVTDSTLPNQPLTPFLMASSATSIIASWSDNSNNEEGFILQKSDDGINYINVTATIFSYPQSPYDYTIVGSYIGVKNGTTRYFRVKSYNDTGESSYGPVATIVW